MRKYTIADVPKAVLNRIVQAGLLSPSGHNARAYELIVVTSPKMLKALSECRDAAKMLADAKAAIVVLGDESKSDTWIEDCSCVMSNMHLMADYLGVGSCWIQGRGRNKNDEQTTESYVRELLNFPENLRLEAILSLGMAAEHPARRETADLPMEKVHYDNF